MSVEYTVHTTLNVVLQNKKIQEVNFLITQKKGKHRLTYMSDVEIPFEITADDVVEEKNGKSIKVLNIYTEAPIIWPNNFKYFQKNKIIEIVNFNNAVDFSELKDISSLFKGCYNLEQVDFGNASFKNLKNASIIFGNCLNLVEIKGFDFNFPQITEMSDAFHQCKKLKKLDFSKGNLPMLENTEFMFQECTQLQEIDMSQINLSSLKYASYMFYDCNQLKKVVVKNIPELSDCKEMFAHCEKLKEIDVDFNFKKLEHTKKMFYFCKSLEFFDFSKFKPQLLRSASMMFGSCINLKGEVVFPHFKYVGEELNAMFSNCCLITKIDIRKVELKNTSQFINFARNCNALESIEFGKIESEAIFLDDFVHGCKSLVYLSFENMNNTSQVIANYFAEDCINLKVVNLGFSLNNTSYAHSMFRGCSNLRVVSCYENDIVHTGKTSEKMFDECSSLNAITLTNTENKLADAIKFLPESIKLVYINKEYKNDYRDLGDFIIRPL